MTPRVASTGIVLLFTVGVATMAGCRPVSIEQIFLRPTELIEGTPADMGYAFDTLDLPIDGGRRVSAWHVHAENPKAVVVIVPGSDRNKSRYLIALPVFIPNGYDVVLMDYEGFGESEGDPTLANMLDDGLAVVDYALTRHERVVAFGVSLGTPIASWIAAQRELSACIFEASAMLLLEPALYLLNEGIPVPFLWDAAILYITPQVPREYNLYATIQQVAEPKLFMHSTEDDTTPYAGGRLAYRAAPEPKDFWTMYGGHGEMIELDVEAYTSVVIGWLDRWLADSPAAE